ncbi:exosortase B [Rhodoferax sp. OV413]|uniref:exosortase B n=1 Tax=Rhodoferax sp. OV413 TaxID=1855285 RepID=UPI000890654F|nr:exosortase B [Rhodoferax sp. OV413]SDP79196.1 exosortase B [Rhodoferax sp. OV413]
MNPEAQKIHVVHTAKPLRAELVAWLPVILGLAVLYVPSLHDLLTGVWNQDEQRHGPIVLGIAIWLVYRSWPSMVAVSLGKATSPWGWPIVVFSLLLYILGRSQDILMFEVGSVVWLLVGTVLLMYGSAALKAQWFGLFFMLFMVPLPAAVVDTLTMPMKMAVSYVAEHVLFWAGYPIGRTGVMLQIGQYRLLVADACAGLHTLLTLEALGLLYLNLVRRDSPFRNLGLAILVVPISFTANVIRVMALTLITYHLGDAAGQGFLHGFAGMVLFTSALLLIIGVDTLLHTAEAYYQRRNAPQGVAS